jgi:hypothetical protein
VRIHSITEYRFHPNREIAAHPFFTTRFRPSVTTISRFRHASCSATNEDGLVSIPTPVGSVRGWSPRSDGVEARGNYFFCGNLWCFAAFWPAKPLPALRSRISHLALNKS